jgi:uncharacterized membrane protein YdbT with pleckstrin-like domain
MGPMVGESGLSEGERLVLKLHQHWKTVLRPVTVLALIIAATLVVLILVPRLVAAARLGVGAAALVLAIVFVAGPMLRWWTTSYELTNRRLRLRAGVLTRNGRDFPLSRISDVSFSQSVLDRVLGCGRLVVESPGEHGQLVMTEIPHVQQVQATLFQLVEDEQARLSREIPDPY